MRGQKIFGVFVAAMFALAMFHAGAFSQQKSTKDQLVGAWTFVSVTAERADGSKEPL
jgi:archaellin